MQRLPGVPALAEPSAAVLPLFAGTMFLGG